ncbi:hypothetical protein [Robertmurraya siralis]|uniref:hypothetical protein n=1 Tax=Robertmurraya siralis TaxID=77777 RepID=UPI0010F46DC2|nr:hypothetical protein [Robertmurraya siralis]
MKIHVEDKLYIESDERQFVLKEYTGKLDNKGNEIYKTLGYFSKINQALKHLVKLKVMKSEATNVKELIGDVERIERKIESLIKT